MEKTDLDIEHIAGEESQQDWNRLEYKEIHRKAFIDGAEYVADILLDKVPKWNDVKDGLPANGKYLVKVDRKGTPSISAAKFTCVASLSDVTRHIGNDSPIDKRWYVFPSGGHEVTNDVTHWMKIPE